MMKNTCLLIITALLVASCAIAPDYARKQPGIKGTVYQDGKPMPGVAIAYGMSISGTCKNPVANATTDDQGKFKMGIDREFQLIKILPSDGCSFSGRLCFADGKSWGYNITGEGEVEYHTGGNVVKQPSRLFFQSEEGYCDPPKWLRVRCDLDAATSTDLCTIVGQDP